MANFNLTTTDGFALSPWVSDENTLAAGAHVLTVLQDTFLYTDDYYGIWIMPSEISQSWTLNINGGVTAYDVGIALNNYKSAVNNIVSVGAEGSVSGGRAAIEATAATTITNSGSIAAYETAINFYDDEESSNSNLGITGKVNTITNNATGTIEAGRIAIRNDSLASLTVTNSGMITGGFYDADWALYDVYDYAAIDSGLGRLTLTNNVEAIIKGNVVAGYAGSTITNNGEIFGTINIRVDVAYEFIGSSYVYMFDVDRDGYFDDGPLGAAQINSYTALVNTITNNAGAVIEGLGSYDYDYYEEASADSDEGATALILSAISDRLTNAGTIYGDVIMGSGNADVVTNTGSIYGSVNLGTGGNTLTNTRGPTSDGVIEGSVFADGRTTVTNAGLIGGAVNLNWIGNVLTNNANSIIQGGIVGDFLESDSYASYFSENENPQLVVVDTDQDGLFNDTGGFVLLNDILARSTTVVNTITNNGVVGAADDFVAIQLSSGRDVVTNSLTGRVDGEVMLGEGADTLANAGVIAGDVDMGWGLGGNVLTNTGSATGGQIAGSVYSGGQLTMSTQSGTIGRDIFLGWIGNIVNNTGIVGGGIISSFLDNESSYEYNDPYFDYNQNAASYAAGLRVDLNKDGAFTDANNTLYAIGTSLTFAVNTITNSGTILGMEEYGYLYYSTGEENDEYATSYFTVAMDLSEGRDVVTNALTGRINGDIWLNSGADSLANSGVINGSVDMGWGLGVNTITNTGSVTGGIINGDVRSGATLTMTTQSGVVHGSVYLGWIGNTITNTNILSGAIISGVGIYDPASTSYEYNSEYISSDDDGGFIFDTDKDGLFNDANGFLSLQSFLTTAAVNTITNSGTIYGAINYQLDDSGNSIDNYYVNAALDLSEGRDLVTNSGRIRGEIRLYGGNDSVTNTATGVITGSIIVGEGANTVVNAGIIRGAVIAYGDGDEYASNKGTTVTNTGTIFGYIELGDGHDIVTTSRLITESVSLGGGNDQLLIGTGGRINGWIDLGSGNDTFNIAIAGISSTVTTALVKDFVYDGEGVDNVNLGAGNDVMFVAPDSDADTFAGGSGIDTLDLSLLDGGVTVNLGATTVLQVAAGKISSGAVTDTISGFEIIIGSDYDDIFVASSVRETFTGSDGADIFIFDQLADSGRLRATRDTITDFEAGTDKIDVSALYSGTFAFAGHNVAFSGLAGSLRSYTSGSQTIVEGDIDGDKKADFGIALDLPPMLVGTDFLL